MLLSKYIRSIKFFNFTPTSQILKNQFPFCSETSGPQNRGLPSNWKDATRQVQFEMDKVHCKWMRRKSIASDPGLSTKYLIEMFHHMANLCFEAYLYLQPENSKKENETGTFFGILLNHWAEGINVIPSSISTKESKKKIFRRVPSNRAYWICIPFPAAGMDMNWWIPVFISKNSLDVIENFLRNPSYFIAFLLSKMHLFIQSFQIFIQNDHSSLLFHEHDAHPTKLTVTVCKKDQDTSCWM